MPLSERKEDNYERLEINQTRLSFIVVNLQFATLKDIVYLKCYNLDYS